MRGLLDKYFTLLMALVCRLSLYVSTLLWRPSSLDRVQADVHSGETTRLHAEGVVCLCSAILCPALLTLLSMDLLDVTCVATADVKHKFG